MHDEPHAASKEGQIHASIGESSNERIQQLKASKQFALTMANDAANNLRMKKLNFLQWQ